MKVYVLLLTALVALPALLAVADETCSAVTPEEVIKNPKNVWQDMQPKCTQVVKKHIQAELQASFTYIAMGAYFLSASNFRPGVAKMFLKHAGEERQHARGLIDYLSMRGEEIGAAEIPTLAPNQTEWPSVLEDLQDTLALETFVRDEFKKIIKVCEEDDAAENAVPKQDYHISDFLTGNFLEEQHHGVHEIANLVSRLGRMQKDSAFAEIEFDRSLLKD